MDLVWNSRVDINMAERIRRSLSFSSKGKEIIERTSDIIDEQDPDKLLEKKVLNKLKEKDYIMKD